MRDTIFIGNPDLMKRSDLFDHFKRIYKALRMVFMIIDRIYEIE